MVVDVPINQPLENDRFRIILQELRFEGRVPLSLSEMTIELDYPHTVGGEKRSVGYSRERVAREPHLELRGKSERFLVEVTGSDGVVTRIVLDFCLVEFARIIGL